MTNEEIAELISEAYEEGYNDNETNKYYGIVVNWENSDTKMEVDKLNDSNIKDS